MWVFICMYACVSRLCSVLGSSGPWELCMCWESNLQEQQVPMTPESSLHPSSTQLNSAVLAWIQLTSLAFLTKNRFLFLYFLISETGIHYVAQTALQLLMPASAPTVLGLQVCTYNLIQHLKAYKRLLKPKCLTDTVLKPSGVFATTLSAWDYNLKDS